MMLTSSPYLLFIIIIISTLLTFLTEYKIDDILYQSNNILKQSNTLAINKCRMSSIARNIRIFKRDILVRPTICLLNFVWIEYFRMV